MSAAVCDCDACKAEPRSLFNATIQCPGSATMPDESDPNTSAWSAPCPECRVIIRRMTEGDGTLFVHETARR